MSTDNFENTSFMKTAVRALYYKLRENEKLLAAVREAVTREEMEEILRGAGYDLEPGMAGDLVELFARELTDDMLLAVTGG